MKKRVILIRSNPVSPDPPVEKMADTLLANDYEIVILGWNRDGDLIDETTKLSFEHGTGTIIRFGIPALFDGGIKKNLLPLLKFQIKLYEWLTKHKDDYDIIHSFDFDTGLIASKIAEKYRKTMVYHILDFYIASHMIPSRYLREKVKKAEFSIINKADATIICTEKRCEQIIGSTPKRLEIIHNTPKAICPINDDFGCVKNSHRCKIVYVGILGKTRFLREIIKFVETNDTFELHIGGFGLLENEIKDAAQRCERIIYYGKLPYEKTLALEQACDIMTAIYDPAVPNHQYSAPNKFYESLMLGKPIVMAQNTGFDEIIQENGIGCVIEYTENGLEEGLKLLLSQKDSWPNMSDKMKNLYRNQYSWEIMENRIINLYKEITDEENIKVHEKG